MPTILTAGDRQIDLSTPVCMGILNVTPDSFSDGALLAQSSSTEFRVDVDKALSRAHAMVASGAQIIDVGGESTRPGARAVSIAEESDRVLPVITALRANLDVCISIDTSSPDVMKAAIDAGAGMVNDVRALTTSGAIDVVAASDVAVCLMHMQGQPRTMQQTYTYRDVVEDVLEFLQQRLAACRDAGIARQRLVVDPGFGFGKSLAHNYTLLKSLRRFSVMEQPVLVGLSRKSMIGGVIDRPVDERLAGSIAATTLALLGGASIVRTHDVAATMDAIRVHSAYSSV
jgi:dihydropteroate synthase